MDSKKDIQMRLDLLREKALARISASPKPTFEPVNREIRELLHDLHVHQIELEMQNEELRQTHHELERSRDRYMSLYHGAPVGYVVADSAGMVLQANNTFSHMVGWDISTLVKKPLKDTIHPDDSALFLGRFRSFFNNPADKRFETRMIHRDGTVIHVELKGQRIEDDSVEMRAGMLAGYLLISVSDTTARKSAEDAIIRAKKQWEQTFDAVPDLIAIIDEASNVVRVNKALARRLGVEPKDCVGKKCYQVLHEDDARPADCPHQLVQKTGRTSETEGFIRKFNGYFLTTVLPFDPGASSNRWCIHISRDITDRKRAEKELLKLRNLESIGKLAGGIAHDFNNILTAVIGHVDLAILYAENQDKQISHLQGAVEAAYHARELANRLITFAEGGNQVKRALDLPQLLEATTGLTLSGTNVAYAFEIAADTPTLIADANQITSAVQNVLTNAREAMPWGGKVVVKSQAIDVEQFDVNHVKPGRYVKIEIRDNGVGIAADDIGRIFDPYFTTKQMGAEKGMGLGLAITHSIVSKHQGHIAVRSEVGEGTTVTILLPTFVTPEVSRRSSVKKAALCPSSGCRVLYMDDEKILWKVIRSILHRLGCETDFAIDGGEAISLYKTSLEQGRPYTALILDLTIRGGPGGKEVLQEILQIDPDAKAVVLSGYTSDPVFEDYGRYGFVGALEKPFKTQRFMDLMSGVLNKALHEKM